MVTPINPAKISLKKSFLFTFLISLKEIDKKISPLIKNLKKPKNRGSIWLAKDFAATSMVLNSTIVIKIAMYAMIFSFFFIFVNT